MWVVAMALAAAMPVKLSENERAQLAHEAETARSEQESWMEEGSGSYLATVARRDFGEKKTLTIGSAKDNDVVLEGEPAVRPHHLTVTVAGDRFELAAVDEGATFGLEGKELRSATTKPAAVELGRFTLRLSHQNFPAILVQDARSPHFEAWKKTRGLQYFPWDPAFRFEVAMTPNPKREEKVVISTRGNQRKALVVGWFEFVVDGKTCRLEADRLLEPGVGENDFLVLFRDATTGKETYPVGRYVEPKKLKNGKFLLDFNDAYNPACAFSEHYNCPIPPAANRLEVAIRAGEKDPHFHHAE